MKKFLGLVMVLGVVSLLGCSETKKGVKADAEKAGAAVKDAGEKMGEKVGEAGDKAAAAVEGAVEGGKKAVEGEPK